METIKQYFLNNILLDPFFIKSIIIFLFIFILLGIYSFWKNRQIKKLGIKPLSWATIIENIKLTLYDDCDQKGTLYVSLPRLGYAISILLVIYVVVANQYEMASAVIGFSITMASAYIAKKKIESSSNLEKNSTINNIIEKVTSMLNTNKIEESENISEETNND
jgi:hypothetical protein